ncbi:PqqD family protein [Bacillus cereus]|uniref:PqqD family protein n=1 Tax=Bacillus sp. BB56-3 TaxID=2217831 RepID=UPI0011EFE98C|nr:PqqD family protein [Bacillus sp. BB56-3]KAA0782843.1 PqqD family protein [Bacillus sp. BB56-3]MCU4759620.1 PqqD family protein [Bacillus cereus]
MSIINDIQANDVYFHHEDIKYFHTESGVGIHSFMNDRFFHLEEVSADIWLLFDGQRSITDIINILSKSYAVETKQLESDVLEFIYELKNKKLIEAV